MKNEEAAFSILVDTLIPGDGAWPRASDAIGDANACLASFSDNERTELLDLALSLSDIDDASRAETARRFERARPDLFGRFVASVMRVYYQGPAAHARIVALAERGPREPSAFFDEEQLNGVRARSAAHSKAEGSKS